MKIFLCMLLIQRCIVNWMQVLHATSSVCHTPLTGYRYTLGTVVVYSVTVTVKQWYSPFLSGLVQSAWAINLHSQPITGNLFKWPLLLPFSLAPHDRIGHGVLALVVLSETLILQGYNWAEASGGRVWSFGGQRSGLRGMSPRVVPGVISSWAGQSPCSPHVLYFPCKSNHL